MGEVVTEQTLREPKLSISKAAEFLGVSVQAVHRQLKNKNIVCPKIGNKSYLTNKISKQLFNINFAQKKIAGQIVKGGTGKTTSIHNIACCASAYGAKVLMIDIDPQGNLTDACGVNAEDHPVLVDFMKDGTSPNEGIVHLSDGLHLIASRIENVILDSTVVESRLPLHTLFNSLFSSIEKNYDFIFIDCPPTIGQIVTAANVYSDIILAPLNPDRFSAKGLKILKTETALLKKHYKKDIEYKVFLNKFSGNTILSDKAIAAIISDPDMEGKCLRTAVRFAQEIPNTTDADRNLFSSIKKSTARDDFEQLTLELLNIDPSTETKGKSGEVNIVADHATVLD